MALATSDEDICNAIDCYSWDGDSCEVDDSQDTGGGVDGDCGYCQECSAGDCVNDDSQDTGGDVDEVCGYCEKCSSGTCVTDDGTDGGGTRHDCGTCKVCDGSSCVDVIVTSVSGPEEEYCQGDTEDVTAYTNFGLGSSCSIEWAGDASVGTTTSTDTTHEAEATLNTIGTNLKINAKTSTQSPAVDQSGSFAVVTVDRIQYDDPDTGYTDISGTLYVHIGTTVTFKAIKEPTSASWPSGKPVWGGSAGASGTGETKAVTFDTTSTSTTDYKTVTAECGNTETVNVVVFEFDGTFQPDDPFDGRSLDRWGLEEEVTLGFTTTPTGITATQAGGLEWTSGGVGDLTNRGPDGTADYDAEELQGGVTFRLEVVSGASAGVSEIYWHDVIKPTGTRMTRVYPPGIHWHEYQRCTVGLSLHYWLDPTDVSFKYLKFGEGACPTTNASGYFLTCEPPGSSPYGTLKDPHAQTPVFSGIMGGDIGFGCRVVERDIPTTKEFPMWDEGDYEWHIPAMYKDNTGAKHDFGGTKLHISHISQSGTATVTKDGNSESAGINDISWPW